MGKSGEKKQGNHMGTPCC